MKKSMFIGAIYAPSKIVIQSYRQTKTGLNKFWYNVRDKVARYVSQVEDTGTKKGRVFRPHSF